MENSHVLALQNFLYAKGHLKATPNGYFGPATLAAVKAYQKSVGFSQVGIAGPATRALIKKTTCQAGISPNDTGAQTAQQWTLPTENGSAPVPFPRPTLESVDFVTLFAGGQTDWGFDIHGSGFSSTTNSVYFKNMGNNMVYAIGTFASASGTAISLPSNMGNTEFSCGSGCSQKLLPGSYEVSVKTPGGQTAGKYMEIKAFTIHSQTGTLASALPANATDVKIGSVSFSTPAPVIVRSVALIIGTSTISADGVSVSSYNDPIRRSVLVPDVELYPLHTMIVEANVTTSNQFAGTVTAYFTVEVEDYIAKRKTTFMSPEFLATILGTM